VARVIRPTARVLVGTLPLFLPRLRLFAAAGAVVAAGWMVGLPLVSVFGLVEQG